MKHKHKGVHLGSYWMGKNDIVYLMAKDLNKLCNLTIVDTDIYTKSRKHWYDEDYANSKEFPVRWLKHDKVIDLVKKEKPSFIICNAGSMSLTRKTVGSLRKMGIVTVGISLSDPDVFSDNGRIYSSYYDLFYTNSQYALDTLYDTDTNCKLLPFAASPNIHKPLKNINKKYDVVVVGHARPERLEIVKSLQKHFNVGLFGKGWGKRHKEVHGKKHVQAINSGKIYLSFAATTAGYTNVKVGIFEAMACRTCVVTYIFDEMEQYFKYGLDVLGYSNQKILVDIIHTHTNNDRLRNWIAENGYRKLLNEHTWTKRWEKVLDDIKTIANHD